MTSHGRHPDQDSAHVAALYLSSLDHTSLYSDLELHQAISDTLTALDDPADLAPVYEECLWGPGAVGDDVRRARRRWAQQMADDLTRPATPG
ncbi:hypothetical protein [Streptomyces sp. HUAS TT20]|uniref:hypothetical protein n=1 Tax=Streptomyces sp. HUAS TT20 TaxID=3447509 RepID=UPI0021D825CC|nr:hypothetical protein [Streptomyces sp. HUAS 15-9]UXY32930.1 hypothetical protein N8I87_38295 [Streptomyces sp. HUAS 15-9]